MDPIKQLNNMSSYYGVDDLVPTYVTHLVKIELQYGDCKATVYQLVTRPSAKHGSCILRRALQRVESGIYFVCEDGQTLERRDGDLTVLMNDRYENAKVKPEYLEHGIVGVQIIGWFDGIEEEDHDDVIHLSRLRRSVSGG